MSQPKSHSIAEAVANVIIGYWVAFFANLVFLPMLGVPVSLDANFKFSLIMTAISLVRSYWVRRLFNRWHPKQTPVTWEEVCIACGKPWDGEVCGQQDNGRSHPVCMPISVPITDKERQR